MRIELLRDCLSNSCVLPDCYTSHRVITSNAETNRQSVFLVMSSNYSRTYANKPRNRVSSRDKTAKIQSFSSETRFLRKSYTGI